MANDLPPSSDPDRRVVSFDDARRAQEQARHVAPPPEHQPMLKLPRGVKIVSGLIVACFIIQWLLPAGWASAAVFYGGFIPARYSGGLPFDAAALWSPLTHVLLHGGWLHLGINLGMLMAFGSGLEQQRGTRGLMIVFAGSALGGAVAQFAFYSDSLAPMIGASGGISGLFGAALMEMAVRAEEGASWRRHARALLPFIAVWIGISLFFGFFGMPGADQPVAWAAHIGGFLAGLALAARRPQAA